MPWGTQLHDRFLLPHFCAQDFNDVIDDLKRGGYPFKPEWFAPHMEFRFPVQGEVTYDGVNLELRTALEPWHVLGEEGTPGGTVRYVDSSVEKLQVKIDNAIEGRHVVTCNGRRVPLHPTGTSGEFVAGVRYRAWQPPEALHPTIGVDAPLTFDLIDTLDRAAPSAAASIMSRAPAAATGRPCRSTPTKPKAGVSPASARSGTRRARCSCRPCRRRGPTSR